MATKAANIKFIAAAGGIAALAGIVFLFRYFKKQRSGEQPPGDPITNAVSAVYTSIAIFPLKKGSKNNYVKELQSALINAYGTGILPAYGADGDWGSETEAAVKSKLGISQIKDKKEFENIIKSLTATTLAAKGGAAAGWTFGFNY